MISREAYERVMQEVKVIPHVEMSLKGKTHRIEVFEVTGVK